MNRNDLQLKAVDKWLNCGRRGLVSMATGVGKTRVALLALQKTKPKKVALLVPTIKLRDLDWPKEFDKWGVDMSNVDRYCYQSAHKIKEKTYDLVILDEVHNLTDLRFEFFNNNKVKDIIGLTATVPEDFDKQELIFQIAPTIIHVGVDDALDIGAIADYQITVVMLPLDKKEKYIEAGSKKKRFKTTEKAQYEYLTRQINKIQYSGKEVPPFLYFNRMRFLYNLKSKTELAKKLLKTEFKNDKSLIFCGSIAQAEEITKYTYHSKTTDEDYKKFLSGKVKHLGVVNAINEGVNIPKTGEAKLFQAMSNVLFRSKSPSYIKIVCFYVERGIFSTHTCIFVEYPTHPVGRPTVGMLSTSNNGITYRRVYNIVQVNRKLREITNAIPEVELTRLDLVGA
jgi:superfamily II DNA or RNA helicase